MDVLYKHLKLPAALLAGALILAGCARWQSRKFDFSQLRDDRAVELDHRLSKARPAVQYPFGEPAGDTSASNR